MTVHAGRILGRGAPNADRWKEENRERENEKVVPHGKTPEKQDRNVMLSAGK
jgi:hypothetical protein